MKTETRKPVVAWAIIDILSNSIFLFDRRRKDAIYAFRNNSMFFPPQRRYRIVKLSEVR
jgi:hypothetical protein